jgi:hypothetical protein
MYEHEILLGILEFMNHVTPYPNGTWACFPGGKRPGLGTSLLTLSSDGVSELMYAFASKYFLMSRCLINYYWDNFTLTLLQE